LPKKHQSFSLLIPTKLAKTTILLLVLVPSSHCFKPEGDFMNIRLLLGISLLSMSIVAEERVIEELLGVTVSEDGITFQVASYGCTQKGHFSFERKEVFEALGPMLPAFELNHFITLFRNKADLCKALIPSGISIFYSFEELGVEYGKFYIENPVGGVKVPNP
jgi:hypothetical protein